MPGQSAETPIFRNNFYDSIEKSDTDDRVKKLKKKAFSKISQILRVYLTAEFVDFKGDVSDIIPFENETERNTFIHEQTGDEEYGLIATLYIPRDTKVDLPNIWVCQRLTNEYSNELDLTVILLPSSKAEGKFSTDIMPGVNQSVEMIEL